MKQTSRERFLAKVDKNGPVVRAELGACWMWTGARINTGYGAFRLNNSTQLAHRAGWMLTFGPIGDGLDCLHKCDNPPCVRIDHLFLGVHKDNMADMATKGRANGGSVFGDRNGMRRHPDARPHGEGHGVSKLTDAAVRDIRVRHSNGESMRSIARHFSMSRPAIASVIHRETWKHVK